MMEIRVPFTAPMATPNKTVISMAAHTGTPEKRIR